jgi:hypothetical protein
MPTRCCAARHEGALLLLLLAAGAGGPGAGRRQLRRGAGPARAPVIGAPTLQLAYVPQPAPLASGRHFGLDIVVCPRAGTPLPVALRVDADMPAHRHGMNYRATVRVLGDGRYRAEGLMLHMPGRWRLLFDVSADGRLQRLVHEVDVP